ncbi:uncharacterized protein PAC_07431 [Phialocephala subalpina]|uniref:Uncharacterized protein n=1 Tax=Phialocephala subalpina TaxID=576137 RepID=A0A1L7WXP4_9HELO|nr:uncharacterized protein PAC_07431 [Phialocephala subalpina]
MGGGPTWPGVFGEVEATLKMDIKDGDAKSTPTSTVKAMMSGEQNISAKVRAPRKADLEIKEQLAKYTPAPAAEATQTSLTETKEEQRSRINAHDAMLNKLHAELCAEFERWEPQLLGPW